MPRFHDRAAERQDSMNAADIISDVQLIDLDHRDAQFVRAELAEKIDAAIAAAVQAEREACAVVAEMREMRYREHDMFPAYGMDGLAREAHDIAAAIRARSNGNGSK